MNKHYLGIDIGSSFMKFVVTDSSSNIMYKNVIRTLSRDKKEKEKIQNYIFSNFQIKKPVQQATDENTMILLI